MTDTLLLIGTTKGAFTARLDRARGSWSTSGPHLPGWEVSALTVTNHGGKPRLLAGTTHYVYGATIRASDDLGESWTELASSPRYDEASGFKLNRIWTLDEGHGGTLFAGVDEAGLFRSDDGGESWQGVDSLTAHPTRPNWFPGAGGLCLHTIIQHPNNPKRIWVAISAVGVFRSDDGGASWQIKTKGLPPVPTDGDERDQGIGRCVHRIVLDPADPQTLYMQFHGGVFRSTDAADSWHAIETGLPGNFGFPLSVTSTGELFIAPLESDEQRFMRNGRLRVYRSRDRGESWQSASAGLPEEPQFVGVLRGAMAADPVDPAGVYFGTTMGQVYATLDGGASWQELPLQLPRVLSVHAHALES